jgi:hypothetical protein
LLLELGVEEVSANLLVLDLFEQRVKKDLVEVKPVQIHFRDALHPGDLDFILNAVKLRLHHRDVWGVFKGVEAVSDRDEETKVLIFELWPDDPDNLVSYLQRVVRNFRDHVNGILENLLLSRVS